MKFMYRVLSLVFLSSLAGYSINAMNTKDREQESRTLRKKMMTKMLVFLNYEEIPKELRLLIGSFMWLSNEEEVEKVRRREILPVLKELPYELKNYCVYLMLFVNSDKKACPMYKVIFSSPAEKELLFKRFLNFYPLIRGGYSSYWENDEDSYELEDNSHLLELTCRNAPDNDEKKENCVIS